MFDYRKKKSEKDTVDSQAHCLLSQAGSPEDGTVVKTEGDGIARTHHGVEPLAVKVARAMVTARCKCFVQLDLMSATRTKDIVPCVLKSGFLVRLVGCAFSHQRTELVVVKTTGPRVANI